MKIEIDRSSGFCFGVQNAVNIAEKALHGKKGLFSLGDIVHNNKEVNRLSALGLKSINNRELRNLKGSNLLIRAHGEPPETYEIARANNNTILDATCPIVKKLQSRIRTTWKNIEKGTAQIVIFGKPGHAEVIGLMGQIENEGIIVSGINDLERINFKRSVYLFSQTTMSVEKYSEVTEMIRGRIAEQNGKDGKERVIVFNSICCEVSNREPLLKVFAADHDIVVFVGGKESSNGRMLFAVCQKVNPHTYFISSPEEIDDKWFPGFSSVGICGATSTPKWLIEETFLYIRKITEGKKRST